MHCAPNTRICKRIIDISLDMVWLMELAAVWQDLINKHHRSGGESYAAKRQLICLCGRFLRRRSVLSLLESEIKTSAE